MFESAHVYISRCIGTIVGGSIPVDDGPQQTANLPTSFSFMCVINREYSICIDLLESKQWKRKREQILNIALSIQQNSMLQATFTAT